MASVTRSSRRADGRKHPLQEDDASSMGARTAFLQHASNASINGGDGGGRTKRHLDVNDFDAIKAKKARISFELLSTPPKAISSEAALEGSHVPATGLPTSGAVGPQASTQDAPAPDATKVQGRTKQQSKVANGIKHELDRLQGQPADTKEPGRKLRSQEAARFKSELSAYFPEYDEVMGNEVKEQHLLNIDTPILVTDSNNQEALQGAAFHSLYPTAYDRSGQHPVRGYGDALYTDLFDTQRIDFGFLVAHDISNKTLDDPLADNLFEPIHKRAERLERSILHTERGRAQHERDQIVRLLNALWSQDWLRVLGVNSIIDAKRREFEPARQYFIKGCQNILSKFKNWSLEEKRRKREKRMLAERAEEEASDSDRETNQDESARESKRQARSTSESSSGPAKQLREEALARSKTIGKAPKRPRPTAPKAPPKPAGPPKEFKSFFSKRYERETALSHSRRAGRKVLAWGHPVPDFPASDFMLPGEYRDAETLRVRARQKRREKRSTRH